MKRLPFSRGKTCGAPCALIWIAGGVVVLLVLVAALSLRNVNRLESQRAVPAGQLQADARTLVAAFGYLLESDSEMSRSEVPRSTSSLCLSNLSIQPISQGAFCCISNQPESVFDPLTNGPSRRVPTA